MTLFDQAVLVSRIAQILIALIAFFIAIATCTDHNGDSYRGSPNGYLMMAAIMCLFDTAALGCVGILSLLKPQDLASYLVLVFDLLALAASIAAGQCISTNANWHWRWDVALRITVIFAYLCTILVLVPITRTIYMWLLKETPGRIQLKEHVDNWAPEDIRKLEKRVEQLEAEAMYRPYSPSETIARWTTVSGNATLSQYQSEQEM